MFRHIDRIEDIQKSFYALIQYFVLSLKIIALNFKLLINKSYVCV